MQSIPAEKVIPGTGFTVDGFRHSSEEVKAYFLSHAHSDHYTGLTENWNQGMIHCSPGTAKLLHHLVGVKTDYITPLAMHQEHHIQGVKVVLVDANHCPGAVQFLFELPNGEKYIHCGDMRFGKHLLQDPYLNAFQGSNAVFLDTTYCNPKYTFPPQEHAVEYVAETIGRLFEEQKQKQLKRVYVITTYVIGKERLLIAVHKKTGCRIGVTQQKMETLKCLDLPGVNLDEVFTTDMASTPVHVAKWGFLGESWPFFRPNFVNMEQYRTDLNADEVVGFVPTGWMYEMKRKAFPVREKGHCFIHLVPYSEHSSYSELRQYVQFLHPHKVVPTVGVHDDASGKKSSGLQKHFRHLVNETASKQRFLRSLRRSTSAREGSGQLLTSRSSGLAAELEPENDNSGEKAGLAPASASAVINVKDETEEEQEHPRDTDALPDLPDSLGIELGDATSLQADPDALLHDSMQASDSTPAQAHPEVLLHDSVQASDCTPAQADSGLHAVLPGSFKASDSTVTHTGTSGRVNCTMPGQNGTEHSEVTNQLLSILAGALDRQSAVKFVARAHGDLAAAINLFYNEGLKSDKPQGGQQPSSSAESAPPSASNESAASAAASSRAAACNGSVVKPSKQAGQPPSSKHKSKGSKRGASNADSGQTKSAAKKAKATVQTGQRSIAAFFGGQTDHNHLAVKAKEARAELSDMQHPQVEKESGTAVKAELQDRPLVVDLTAGEHDNGPIKQEPDAATDRLMEGADSDSAAAPMPAGEVCMKAEESPSMGGGGLSDLAHLVPVKNQAGQHHGSAQSDGQALVKSSTDAADNAEEESHASDPNQSETQSVHPFFSARRSKPGTPLSQPPESRSVPPQQAGLATEAQADRPELRKPLSTKADGSKAMINPFQKASKAEAEREVPADAVLLPVAEYDPVKMAVWEAGQATPYRHISRAFQSMESTTKRLRIGDAIANMFRSILALSPDDMLHAAYLTIGKLAPDYENVELSVGGSTVAAAVVEATGISRARLRDMYTELGDMGDVAQACRHTQTMLHRPAPLTVPGVYKTLRQIAVEKGPGSASRRQQAVLGMLRSCREHETKFLVRTLVSNLRVGANWRSIIGAMARAVVLHREGPRVAKARLDAAATAASEAYHVCPNLAILVPALVEGGIDELEKRCTLTPGVPLKPMLAKISEGVPDAIKTLKGAPFLAEYKYDGTRAQIHLLPDNSVKIFSRNCEDKTLSMPDVVAAIQAAAQGGSSSLVIDAELVAVERGPEIRLKAFQELSTRARGQVAAHQVTMHVCVFVFDLLYVDGEALVNLPLRQRRAHLAAALPNLEPGYVQFATSMEFQPAALAAAAEAAAPAGATPAGAAAAVAAAAVSSNEAQPTGAQPELAGTTDAVACMSGQAGQDIAVPVPGAAGDVGVSEAAVQSIEERIQEFLLESFAGGTEGLMLKALDVAAGYQPSKRSDSWIKLKRDYCEGLRDSLDLVVIGAWHGQGRKTKWYSPFLLAAYDPETEELQSVCRCMSGFTDAFYAEATARLSATAVPGKMPYIRTDESPNVWFEPREVWEIRGADLTISPVHKAAVGLIHPDRGISLRFPRFITIREDKKPEDASTPEVVADLYNKQSRRMASAAEILASKGKSVAAAQGADARNVSDADNDAEAEAMED